MTAVASAGGRLQSLAPRTWPALILCLAGLHGFSRAQATSADSLPAFRPDSVNQDPFRKVEEGRAPWSSNPNAITAPKTRADSLSQSDTVTARLRRRHPAVAVYVGVDFYNLDAKPVFDASLNAFLAERALDSLKVLQPYDPVHLAFPLGLQAVLPVGAYLDIVAKTHSYWYKQTAILGDKNSLHYGDQWYALQANLGGLGLRYYIPPSLLSVTGSLGLYAQGVLFWNLGNSEMYTPYGSAPARFDAYGSGYELQFGVQQSLSGPWQLSGAIGFLKQDFKSDKSWSDIMIYAPPAGKAHWGSSAIQASLNLWYHFGAPADTSHALKNPAAAGTPTGASVPPAGSSVPASSQPSIQAGNPAPASAAAPSGTTAPAGNVAPNAVPAPTAIQPDSTRRK